MKKSDCYLVNPKIVFRREGKEALLFDSRNGDITILNATGIFIWKLCNGKNTFEDISRKAHKQYKGNEDKMKKDIMRFLKCNIAVNCIQVLDKDDKSEALKLLKRGV